MLILTRRTNESIIIGDDITITTTDATGSIGDAPLRQKMGCTYLSARRS